MGPQEDYIETVFTCEGDFDDPELHARLEEFRKGLKTLLLTDKQKLILTKVEPWNSVRVTFNIPREAALKLKHLAQQGNSSLRQLGVLAVQIQGDQLISLTIANRNNERTELVFKTTESHAERMSTVSISENIGPAEQSNVEVTRKNIEEYLRQSNTLFDGLLQPGTECDLFRTPNVVASSSDPIPFHVTTNSSHLPSDFTVTNASSTDTHIPTKQTALSQTHLQLSPGSGPIGQPGIKFPSPTGMPLQNPNTISAMHGNYPLFGYPPPPPYPQGSSLINNIPKTSRGTTVTSPLLVNLLQNEPTSGLISHLMNDRMFSNPEEVHPQSKVRKRRPRKPKDVNNKNKAEKLVDAEISIHSIPNPALNSGVSPVDRIEQSLSGVPSIQPLAATDNVKGGAVSNKTNSSSLPVSSVMQSVNQRTSSASSTCDQTSSYSLSDSAIHNSFQFQVNSLPGGKNDNLPFFPENTAGKIINPYTGQLEPMENLSDTSPTKSDSAKDGKSVTESIYSKDIQRSPGRDVQVRTESACILKTTNQIVNPAFSLGPQNLSDECAKQHSHLHDNFLSNHEQRAQISNLTSCANKSTDLKNDDKTFPRSNARSKSPRSFGLELESNQSNNRHFDMLKENMFTETGTQNTKPSQFSLKTPLLHNNIFHTQNKSRLVEKEHVKPQVSQYDVRSQELDDKKENYSLLNATLKTSESHSGNVIESPESKASDQDSENSSLSSLIHDTGTDHLHSTAASKMLNHDSGIGSNSDDTPSEPGDTDFKTSQKMVKASPLDIVMADRVLESTQRQSGSKCDNKVITVGYAFAGNNPVSINHKMGSEIPTMLSVDKYKTSETTTNVNCVMSAEKNPNPVTILHWSMKDGLPANLTSKSLDPSSHKQEGRSGRNSPRVNQRLTPPSVKESKTSSPSTPSFYGVTSANQSSFSSAGYSPAPRTLTQHTPAFSFAQDIFSSPPKSHDGVSLHIGDHSLVGHPRLGIPIQPARQPSPTVNASQQMTTLNISSGLMSVSNSGISTSSSNIAQRNPISSSVTSECAKHNSRSNSPRASVPSSFSNPHITDTLGVSLSKSSICLASAENNKGSNITSIYSKTPKRSTPTSASSSMFVSELPLPKRLTESIQKLVKPLGDTSTLHFRKSPVSSSSKQASVNSPPRISAVSNKNLSPKNSDNSPQSSTSASIPDNTHCDNAKSQCTDVSVLSCVTPSATVPSTPPITVVSSLSQDTVVTSCISVLSSPSCDYLKYMSDGTACTQTVSTDVHSDSQKDISSHTIQNSATYNAIVSDCVDSHTQGISGDGTITKCDVSESSNVCYNALEPSSHAVLTDDMCLNNTTAQPPVSKNIPSPLQHCNQSPSYPDACSDLNTQSSQCSIIDSTTSEINDQRQDCVYSQNSNTERTCDSNSASSTELSDANKCTLSLDTVDPAQSPQMENNVLISENLHSASVSHNLSVSKPVHENTTGNFFDSKIVSSCDLDESKFIHKSSHAQSEGNIDDCDSLTSDICDSSGSVVSRDDVDSQASSQVCSENLHKDLVNSLDAYPPGKGDKTISDSVSQRTLRTRSRGNSGGENNEDDTVSDVSKHLRILTKRRKNSEGEITDEILNKKTKLDVVGSDDLHNIVLNCVDKVVNAETLKNDLSHLDSNDLENLQASDIVRRSARVRAQHTDEKVKKVPSELKRDKLNVDKLQSTFDEDGKKGCRRPKLPIEPLGITLEEKAQMRGRMRSAITEMKEEITDSAKRSTRLTKTKETPDSVQIKRRRSSRDHR